MIDINSLQLHQDPQNPSKMWLYVMPMSTAPGQNIQPVEYTLTQAQFNQLQNAGIQATPEWNNPLYYNQGAFDLNKLTALINQPSFQETETYNGPLDTVTQQIAQNKQNVAQQRNQLLSSLQKIPSAPTTGATLDLNTDTQQRQYLLNNAYQRDANGNLVSIGTGKTFEQQNNGLSLRNDNSVNQNPSPTGNVSASTQNTQSAQLGQPQFILGADGQTVYDQNGNYVSLDQYKQLTGQTNVPDAQLNWSYVSQPGTANTGTTNTGAGTGVGTGTGTGAAVTLPDGSTIPSTGDPKYDALLQQMNQYLQQLVKNGQQINPNVTITPDKLAEFTQQATQQLHPYYATQLQAATDAFLQKQGYSVNNYNTGVTQAQTNYGRSLENLGSNMADQGFAQSGIRLKQENQLAQDTQNSIDQARNSLVNSSADMARSFAQTYGGQNALGLNTPNITTPRVLPGQPNFDTTQSTGLYTLSPNIYSQLIGSEQNAEKSATDTLSSQLQSNYVQQQSNAATRTLNTPLQ